MKTRAKPITATAKELVEAVQPKSLPAPDLHPHKAFILPRNLSQEARIFTHPHPRTQKSTRFYHCPETGFYEIKTFSSGPVKKSFLLAPDRDEDREEGYVLKTASFQAVTPLDPIFLILPALSPASQDGKEKKPMFLSLDDHLDSMGESGLHLRHVCHQHKATVRLIESRISRVCDAVSAGDEKMYRLNQDKLLSYLVRGAEIMVKAGLPPSMEEHFVKKPLEVPMAYLLQQEAKKSSLPIAETTKTDILETSQQSSGTSTPAMSSAESQSTTITVPSPPSSSQDVSITNCVATDSTTHLLRLRVALIFLLSSYIPTHLSTTIQSLVNLPTSPLDFTPLDTHLSSLSALKKEISAQARDLMSGDSRKRALEDEEANAERDEKKRKLAEEEKKRKANESRGIRDLKKVDTKGMKKMSEFFGRKKS